MYHPTATLETVYCTNNRILLLEVLAQQAQVKRTLGIYTLIYNLFVVVVLLCENSNTRNLNFNFGTLQKNKIKCTRSKAFKNRQLLNRK